MEKIIEIEYARFIGRFMVIIVLVRKVVTCWS
jgi:hypothetical protein